MATATPTETLEDDALDAMLGALSIPCYVHVRHIGDCDRDASWLVELDCELCGRRRSYMCTVHFHHDWSGAWCRWDDGAVEVRSAAPLPRS